MAYTPTTWNTGDTINATKLNNIEQGIVALNTKTTGSGTAENTYVTVSYSWVKRANICTLYLEATPKLAISGSTGGVTLSNIPIPSKPSYSATYDSSSAATVCGPAEITTAGTVCLYGARTKDHIYKAGFTYVIN